VKSWDAIVIGGGIIGLSLSLELRKAGFRVLIVERGEPGREASYAAGGMLVDCPCETPAPIQPLATAGARMYPEFVHELQDESGIDIDLRDSGTLLFPSHEHRSYATLNFAEPVSASQITELEPSLTGIHEPAWLLAERSVDPRALTLAAVKSAKHRGIDFASGTVVHAVAIQKGCCAGVITKKTTYHAPVVVNCAGAWAGQINPLEFPTIPKKGQIFDMLGAPALRHVVRADGVYLIPRTDGRLVIGATIEDAGFNKRVDADVIEQMRDAAIRLMPDLAQARLHEAWAGLRPGTPDDLPILGATKMPGYFVATGHFRDGILLAPITARIMTQVMMGENPDFDISAFSAKRFEL
jgi:glycine oxidase